MVNTSDLVVSAIGPYSVGKNCQSKVQVRKVVNKTNINYMYVNVIIAYKVWPM